MIPSLCYSVRNFRYDVLNYDSVDYLVEADIFSGNGFCKTLIFNSDTVKPEILHEKILKDVEYMDNRRTYKTTDYTLLRSFPEVFL